MSIKYGTTDVSDVKINQNGTLVQVNKIVKDDVTLWQKGSEVPTRGGKWRGKYFGWENQVLEWDSERSLWVDDSWDYELVNREDDTWRLTDVTRNYTIQISRYSKRIQFGSSVDITWSAT